MRNSDLLKTSRKGTKPRSNTLLTSVFSVSPCLCEIKFGLQKTSREGTKPQRNTLLTSVFSAPLCLREIKFGLIKTSRKGTKTRSNTLLSLASWRLRVIIFVLFLLPALTFTQTADEMDTLLETQTVTVARAARFILGAVELLPTQLSGTEAETAAYSTALSKGWVSAGANEAITLRDTAFLIMNAFELKGGLMYRLFRNPRYAYREMIYHRLIQGKADPAMTVSGQRLLHILGRTLTFTGEEEWFETGGMD